MTSVDTNVVEGVYRAGGVDIVDTFVSESIRNGTLNLLSGGSKPK